MTTSDATLRRCYNEIVALQNNGLFEKVRKGYYSTLLTYDERQRIFELTEELQALCGAMNKAADEFIPPFDLPTTIQYVIDTMARRYAVALERRVLDEDRQLIEVGTPVFYAHMSDDTVDGYLEEGIVCGYSLDKDKNIRVVSVQFDGQKWPVDFDIDAFGTYLFLSASNACTALSTMKGRKVWFVDLFEAQTRKKSKDRGDKNRPVLYAGTVSATTRDDAGKVLTVTVHFEDDFTETYSGNAIGRSLFWDEKAAKEAVEDPETYMHG